MARVSSSGYAVLVGAWRCFILHDSCESFFCLVLRSGVRAAGLCKKWAGLTAMHHIHCLQTAREVRATSLWAKKKEKKATKKYHARNFGTGHVEADWHYLSRVGLRGRKRWLLLSALILGYLFVLGHLAVS